MTSPLEVFVEAGSKGREQEPVNYDDMELMAPLPLGEFIGRPILEVKAAVLEKYGPEYHISGIEYEKYLLRHPEKILAEMKSAYNACFYFMGDPPVEDQNGNFFIPRVDWPGLALHPDYSVATILWNKDCRVLLLKKKGDSNGVIDFAKARKVI